MLVEFFLRRYAIENGKEDCRFSAEALRVLEECPWQGNVRELENAVERAVVLTYQSEIGPDLLPDSVLQPSSHSRPGELDTGRPLHEIVDAFERQVILDRLQDCGWSQTAAAESFHVPLSTLNQKIKRMGIDVKGRRERSSA